MQKIENMKIKLDGLDYKIEWYEKGIVTKLNIILYIQYIDFSLSHGFSNFEVRYFWYYRKYIISYAHEINLYKSSKVAYYINKEVIL